MLQTSALHTSQSCHPGEYLAAWFGEVEAFEASEALGHFAQYIHYVSLRDCVVLLTDFPQDEYALNVFDVQCSYYVDFELSTFSK